MDRLEPKQRVGEFVLIERIGSGGFGQVWKGQHAELGDLVAMKFPTDPDFVRQLRAEAILQHKLDHPGIVRTVTVNTSHDPPYLVTEFVEGESLRGMLQREGKLAPDRAVKIATEVLEALGYAHERGVVHRDVKPENILIGRDGRVRVTDFGLGLVSEKVGASIVLSGSLRTSGGASIEGTLAYMAPEQRKGGTVDARADLYAVGLVLHEMLTGEISPVVIPIEGAPAHVSEAVRRATKLRPEERFASAAEMAQALRGPQAGENTSRPHAVVEPERRPSLPEPPARARPLSPLVLPREMTVLSGHSGGVWCVAFSPDGRLLATGSYDNTARLWSVPDGKPLATLQGHDDPLCDVAFSPDGRLLASGSEDNTARLWSVSDGKPLATLKGHGHWVWSVAFSPDGRLLATGSRDNTAWLWSVPDGKPLATLRGHGKDVKSVAFSPDGRFLATGSADNTARLWSVPDGKPLATLRGHGNAVSSVAFSPDGRFLATGSDDMSARLWSVPDGKPLATLRGHDGWVWSVAFSPNGRLLATVSHDWTARLWSVPDGTPLATLRGHGNAVSSVAFSPDGRLLASGSEDHAARLWSVPDGKPLATLQGHGTGVSSVAFSPDGRLLATGSWDHTARLWSLEIPVK